MSRRGQDEGFLEGNPEMSTFVTSSLGRHEHSSVRALLTRRNKDSPSLLFTTTLLNLYFRA